ncbi:hypothetical protein CA223_22410 [Sphingomonas koreensis]|uniref:Uncharacterized protein n=1 Tax=Sphingomonas koreensis TaxID=93064 RepID=A0AAJ4RZS3_9SPHN|nr:hypothetical protein CA224_22835 [Sphingomonas koreensis]RSU19461.1 hypothetical protein CA222_22765 [Sphingomonas koreensis]RSU20707.1 hypothetical protein CA225_22445 [Sphingomonas koreensis]RSU27554.1 hypothetical protein BRX39_22765 [Sphingomonas koreensis]RSU33036.1 hypothetical protein CA223_22410 [Sphingomonas koreensis]
MGGLPHACPTACAAAAAAGRICRRRPGRSGPGRGAGRSQALPCSDAGDGRRPKPETGGDDRPA